MITFFENSIKSYFEACLFVNIPIIYQREKKTQKRLMTLSRKNAKLTDGQTNKSDCLGPCAGRESNRSVLD